MTPEEQFDQIEAYLLGQMKEADKKAFERELDVNEDLQKLVAQHRLEHEAMELLVERDLLKRIDEWEEESEQKNNTPVAKRRILWPALAIAASIALLLLFYFLYPTQESSAIQLAEQFYEAPAMERGAEPATVLQEGQYLFAQKAYVAAIERFENITTQDSMYWLAKEWQGHAQYKLGQLNQAINTFSLLSNEAPRPYDHRGDWNLILMYLIQDKKVEAKERLDSIVADENHLYHPLAKQLTKKL